MKQHNFPTFLRLAATLEPPPKMMEALEDIVSRYVRQHSTERLITKIPIDVSGWKYESLFGGIKEAADAAIRERAKNSYGNMDESMRELTGISEEKFIENMLKNVNNVKVVIERGNPPKGIDASWSDSLGQITITLGEAWDYETLRTVMGHELKHFAQTYISLAAGNKPEPPTGGMPPKSMRNPWVTQFDKELWESGEITEEEAHTLDDSEYYPIVDAIVDIGAKTVENGMKLYKSKYPEEYMDIDKRAFAGELLKEFIGGEKHLERFRELGAMAKWQRAVSLLYKEVEKLLPSL